VKIDQSLIQKAEQNHRIHKILPGLIKMIKDLGAQPIITGIETKIQLDIAIESDASLVQGYFLAKPVTANELQPAKLFKTNVVNPNFKSAA
jgi:EAL domain-containing protein (putative c-di-GMP-specific phosphodiesterase class I)